VMPVTPRLFAVAFRQNMRAPETPPRRIKGPLLFAAADVVAAAPGLVTWPIPRYFATETNNRSLLTGGTGLVGRERTG
jgi:hypothetical protein